MKNQKFILESAADGTFSILRRNGTSGKLETHMVNLTKEQAEALTHNMNLNFAEEESEEQDENTDHEIKESVNADEEDSTSAEDEKKRKRSTLK